MDRGPVSRIEDRNHRKYPSSTYPPEAAAGRSLGRRWRAPKTRGIAVSAVRGRLSRGGCRLSLRLRATVVDTRLVQLVDAKRHFARCLTFFELASLDGICHDGFS